MNWFKAANDDIVFDIDTIEDRNLLNEKVRFLESAEQTFKKLSKIVFQDARIAKEINFGYAHHKTLSSYPRIRDMMLTADQVALDSPWKFSELCFVVADEISRQIRKIEKARKEFSSDGLSKHMKGWVDNA